MEDEYEQEDEHETEPTPSQEFWSDPCWEEVPGPLG